MCISPTRHAKNLFILPMQARRLHASYHASDKATCLMPCKPQGYMPHAMQARRLHASCHASHKATFHMPCKPEGSMPHAMQARRLHVSCHASQKATCLMPCKPEGYMSVGGRTNYNMYTSWQTNQHMALHTAHGEKHKQVLHCTNHNLEHHMQEQVDNP